VIIDIPRFVAAERPYWDELQALLDRLEVDPEHRLPLADIQRLHYLYERSSAGLSRLDTFSTDPSLRGQLETLVARAYTQIHETRSSSKIRWRAILFAFPRAFRRHLPAAALSLGITLLGCGFGWYAVRTDPNSKAVIMPFQHLLGSPGERVQKEESVKEDRLTGAKTQFSANLMTHNIQVTILTLALGITWGVGTIVSLFYNGVILGAVSADYIAAGFGQFLTGWLLPHGAVEIPAILLGGQGGFILASALIGWGGRTTRSERFRAIAPDLFAIVAGGAAMLVWAGTIEAFVSQYHKPVIPYGLKIAFGCCELIALSAFLGWAGRE